MIGYLDIPSGVSGDMFLGCLVDAGWPLVELKATIAKLKLPVEEYAINQRQLMKGAIRATFVEVIAAEGHQHRNLADIRKIIEGAGLVGEIERTAVAIFTRLAHAEAKVHGTTVDQIHFHEVGAVDAIIDIVGAAAGLHALGITKLYSSPVPLGPGWANTAHGQIPLPAPATLELLAAANAATRPAPGPGELITPTGAAILAQCATFMQPPMTLTKIAMGAGRKDFPWPNLARLWLGHPVAGAGSLVQLDTNIDDMNPQLYAAVQDKLFAAGAKDVWFTPIQMKKNRPGVLLSTLAPTSQEQALAGILLKETTTLGVRAHAISHRHEAQREFRQIDTPYGAVNAKLKYLDNQLIGATPEYEDCRALAERANVSVKSVHDAAVAAAQALLPSAR